MPCPYCSNSGKIKSLKSITIELQRKLLYLVRKTRNKEGIEKEIIINVILHPDCLSELKQSNEQVLLDIEKHYGARIKFQSNPEYHIEYYNITNIS